jgi:hypothetical protein
MESRVYRDILVIYRLQGSLLKVDPVLMRLPWPGSKRILKDSGEYIFTHLALRAKRGNLFVMH